MACLQPTRADGIAIDPVPVDQVEHEGWRIPGESGHGFTLIGTEALDHSRWVVFETGNDLPTIPARGAITRLHGFQQDGIDAIFG
jgi:hypothetical protein